ncbi:histone acetyltransferase 1 isoform X2 [Arctopsyche grandis]|uniref:histone acetyltransferase 1 isoform X2 n=1 Tax=Arctopsyche grandis TaxID=121162 RepID=UPI00406D9EFD
MTSRLERLFVLLESGSSSVTRHAAAQQLGEVQKLRPHELHRLLGRVYVLLRSTAWETRIAAGQAFEAILKNVPQWNPEPCSVKKDENNSGNVALDVGRLRFSTFDIENVLAQGAHLMGSEGKEYDFEDPTASSHDLREKLIRQRQLLNARLGLDIASKMGMDMSDVFSNDDLINHTVEADARQDSSNSALPHRKPIGELVLSDTNLSSREINRARRKARQQKVLPSEELSTPREEPEKKRFKTSESYPKIEENIPLYGEWLPEADGSWGTEVEWWPLEGWASALAADLFSVQWETRHGAATALRELLKSHGSGAGKERASTSEQMDNMHQSWMEDISLRLLCVLALDRFGDFVSDQVIAPVRETCAQCLGVAASLLGSKGIIHIATSLKILANQSHWEARHGALLGFKYLLVVQQKSEEETKVFLPVVRALWDPVEDVAAAAARALIPVTKSLMKNEPSIIPLSVRRLCRLLRVHDEVAAACGSYMELLATLLEEPGINTLLGPEYIPSVICLLWPYLSHPTNSVRRSALQTLQTLTKCAGTVFANYFYGIEYKQATCSENKLNNEAQETSEVKIETTKIESQEFINIQDGMKALGIESDDIDTFEDDNSHWSAQLLQDTLRHIFQRVLVEHVQDIKNMIEEVWANLVCSGSLECLLHAACPYVSIWICFTMQPSRIPFDSSQLIQPKHVMDEKVKLENSTTIAIDDPSSHINGISNVSQKWFVGGSETTTLTVRENNVMLTRCMASKMIGLLSRYIIKPAPNITYSADVESPIDCYIKVLLVHLSSKSALQRLVVGLIITYWARTDSSIKPCPPELANKIHQCLLQPIYFDEIAFNCTRILQDTRDFVAMMRHYKLPLDGEEFNNIINLEQVLHITSQYGEQLINKAKLKPKISQSLEERRKNIMTAAVQCSNEQNSYYISTQATLAGACTNLYALPDKLNPVIKPIMESIKKEEDEHLQKIAAENLAILLSQCIDRQPCPNPKVFGNLCTFLKSDSDSTPRIVDQKCIENEQSTSSAKRMWPSKPLDDQKSGILTLTLQQKNAERIAFKRSHSTNHNTLPRGPGRPPHTDIPMEELFPPEDEIYKQNQIQRRGATFALINMTTFFGEKLPEKMPKLWECIMQPLDVDLCNKANTSVNAAEDVISSLQVLEVVAPHVQIELIVEIFKILDCLILLLENVYKGVRHMAARCIATLANIDAPKVMQKVVDKVIPLLSVLECNKKRQGASEVLACIIDKLQINVVPYIVLLVVPLLGRMSDHDESVRLMSTHCFATLIQLMPLDGAIKEPTSLSDELQAQRTRDRQFLQQLFNPKSIEDYKIPIPISAELRSYQQAGVNWLAFLNKYKLHGVLCDDMGLGKTLQSICIIAGDHYYREQRFKETKSPDSIPLPSLVICPPTLTGHWVYEVNKFLLGKYLTPLHYMGPPAERERLRCKINKSSLIIASYDIVRKDIDFFNTIKWNYCVLDEGHIVKNGKTKASKAIKTIVANHRLILSGTPIQNNVLELWSLFDFLMPGLLGTERQFTARYSKPILAARDQRATPLHLEAGALAMEALHRQVLPFLLRRMKEDVLKELPPKITQDYYCELSPLQKRLYEDFSRTHMPNGIEDGMETQQHIFQALRYLQNVCNHPKLVLTSQHPEFANITHELAQSNSSLNDIQHAAKLPALRQLLQDCGIGCMSSDTNSVLSQHRALIFCQLKGMLEVIENDLLKPLLPQVSYLRLDGTVSPSQRQSVVQRFNNDPSIDVLLLTTQVGGLGLNLVGADTVIFVEHDWNPMKDLQAMDRAHRIGQKRVVNVYRLITRATLEEKIMGLQKFKLLTANTVISSENASLETMGTDKLLELFPNSNSNSSSISSRGLYGSGPVTMKAILDNLPDLWEDKQYETEYDMTNFVQSLFKK